jgi:hypothetical protein
MLNSADSKASYWKLLQEPLELWSILVVRISPRDRSQQNRRQGEDISTKKGTEDEPANTPEDDSKRERRLPASVYHRGWPPDDALPRSHNIDVAASANSAGDSGIMIY